MASAMRTARVVRPLVVAAASTRRAALVCRTASASSAPTKPSWDIRMLYDGECPLCMREVDFLKGRDAGKGKIDFVDIASPSYSAEDNFGIDYDQAMRKIHAVKSDGTIVVGVEVFRLLYEAVGLGFVYSFIKIEPLGNAMEALYNVWAKYRMEVTGRENIELILAKRRAGDSTMCSIDGTECKDTAKETVTSATSRR